MAQAARLLFARPRSSDSTEQDTGGVAHIFRDVFPMLERLGAIVQTERHQERLAEEANRRSQRIREEIRRRADHMEIPRDEDLRAVVEDADASCTAAMRAVRRALKWRGAQQRGLLLVLGGRTGVGKTAAACHALVRDDRGGAYVCAQAVCAAPRTGFSTVEILWSKWTSVPMLVIDDAGTEGQRPELIRDLVLARFDAGLATIMTSNLSRSAIAERYLTDEHGRLADRLINAQGRGVGDAVGAGGQPWYVDIAGASLRSVEVRQQLHGKKP